MKIDGGGTMDIYLTEYGTKLKKSGEAFCIVNSEGEHFFAPNTIDAIIIEEKISITSDALQLAIINDVPIVFSDKLGNILGRVWKFKFGSNAKIRRKQLEFFETEIGSELGKEWVICKANNQILHLEKLFKRRKLDSYSEELEKMRLYIEKISELNGVPEKIRATLMGYEGNISKIYFRCISEILPEKWRFKEREYRGAKEPFNI
ncbi:MAG: CRISPR-associated endonuclease Cas1, partial [Fusobacteriaceae bacterium]